MQKATLGHQRYTHNPYVPKVTTLDHVDSIVASMAWAMRCFCGLTYVTAYACLYGTSVRASMIHLWATIRSISLHVTKTLKIPFDLLNNSTNNRAPDHDSLLLT
jgi:hypothetical protein